MDANLFVSDLECDVGVAGTISTTRLPPSVVAAVIQAVSDIVVSLLHQQN